MAWYDTANARDEAPEVFAAIDDARIALQEGRIHEVHIRAIEDEAEKQIAGTAVARQRFQESLYDGSDGSGPNSRHRDSMG